MLQKCQFLSQHDIQRKCSLEHFGFCIWDVQQVSITQPSQNPKKVWNMKHFWSETLHTRDIQPIYFNKSQYTVRDWHSCFKHLDSGSFKRLRSQCEEASTVQEWEIWILKLYFIYLLSHYFCSWNCTILYSNANNLWAYYHLNFYVTQHSDKELVINYLIKISFLNKEKLLPFKI